MNLGKLLGAGKSIFGNRPMASYRLHKRMGLPKFNEGRNPFGPKPAEPAPQAAAKPEAAVPKAPPPYAFKPAASLAAKAAGRPGAPAPAKPDPAPAKASRPGWTTRLNPFRPPEPEAPPVVRQAELSLDAVKVVHNDLADAEVDVVPVKSSANAPVAAPMLPPARQAWEYLGENLLKSS